MSKQIRLRRGTTAQHTTFTGAQGEVTFDTDKNCLVVHDGVTPGGKPLNGIVVLDPGAPEMLQQILSGIRISGTGATEGLSLEIDNGMQCSGPAVLLGGAYVASSLEVPGCLIHNVTALAYGASVALNLSSAFAQSLALTGNVTFTTANRGPGLRLNLFLSSDASSRTLTWPAGWKWLGGSAPASIAANKSALLELFCFGTNDSDILARYTVQP